MSEDSPDQALVAIGRAVVIAQMVEALIRMCTTYVFPGEPLTIESLERLEQRERRKTIGHFVRELKKRVLVRDDFDDLLSSFVENRNTLIHRPDDVEGWDLSDDVGKRAVIAFADKVASDAGRLVLILVGFVRAWQVEAGFPDPPSSPEANEFLARIDAVYVPLIDVLVREKNSGSGSSAA